MFEAKRLKILLAHEQERGIFDGRNGGGVIPAVEHGKLGYRTAWSLDGQDLFAPASGTFENPDMPAFDHIEPCAGLALGENGLTRGESAGDGALT